MADAAPPTAPPSPSLAELLDEYDLARAHSEALVDDLSEEQIRWRPRPDSSAIGWHLGHQAAVNHFLVRNLVAAEPLLDPRLDALFDSATSEVDRGDLPAFADLLAYRAATGRFTRARVEAIAEGRVGAPAQLTIVATTLLRAVINHEYQHDEWIGEMREALGAGPGPAPSSARLVQVDGYWTLA